MKKIAIVAIALGFVLIAWVAFELGRGGIGGAARGSAPARTGSAEAAAPGWTTQQDPLGFSVQIPVGWRASADRKSGRVTIEGMVGERVAVWPVFIPGQVDPSSAVAVTQRLCAEAGPDVQWEQPQLAIASAVRAAGRSGQILACAIFTWASSPKGSAGYLYVITAPEAQFAQGRDTYARILQSFKITGAPAGSAPQVATSYVRWQDPREQAFSLEVPAGWQATGGLFRHASVDTRVGLLVRSPDGQVTLSAGDAEIPPFTEPNQTLEWTGFHEGSWYSPGYGLNMMVRRYMSGVDFAREYVASKVAQSCSDLQFSEARDRPDIAQLLDGIYRQVGGVVNMSLSTGEVAFACSAGGGSMRGYYFAGTLHTQGQGFGQWNVEYLHGFLSTVAKADEAQAALAHMVQTFRINPAWASMQQNITAQTSQIVSQTNAEISKIIDDSYWSRQATMDEISRRRSNATLGVLDAVDPATGRELKVESSSNYYWIDQRGTIVGTETDTKPDIDFRSLVVLP